MKRFFSVSVSEMSISFELYTQLRRSDEIWKALGEENRLKLPTAIFYQSTQLGRGQCPCRFYIHFQICFWFVINNCIHCIFRSIPPIETIRPDIEISHHGASIKTIYITFCTNLLNSTGVISPAGSPPISFLEFSMIMKMLMAFSVRMLNWKCKR